MQIASTFVQSLVCFRETMIEAKVVRPGRGMECLCPLHRLLKVTLERPVPRTNAAVDMSALAHEIEESLNIFLEDHILDFDDDRTASRPEIECNRRGVEFLQRVGVGVAAVAKRKQDANCGDEQ